MLGFRSNSDSDVVAANPPRRLGDLLLSSQLLTPAQLSEAEEESNATGEFLCKVLVQRKFITQDDINSCFVKLCKIPHISLMDYDVGTDMLSLIPKEICLKYGLLPIDKLGRILTVAMVDPLDEEALELIRSHCAELRIKPILCNWAHFEQVSRKYFSTGGSKSDVESGSMASFGLSALPPKPATPKPAAAQAAPPPAGASGGASGGASASKAAPAAVDTTALIGAIQEGLRGVVQELATQRTAGVAAEVAAPFSAETLAGVMRASIRDAMSEALQTLDRAPAPAQAAPPAAAAPDWSGFQEVFRSSLEEMKESLRAPQAAAGAVAPAPAPDWSGFQAVFRSTLEELKESFRAPQAAAGVSAAAPAAPVQDWSGLEAVFRSSLNELKESLRPPAPAPEAASAAGMERAIQDLTGAIKNQALPAESISETIRESIGAAMQEALASVIVQLRATHKPEQDPPPFESFAEMIRDTIGGVMQEAMATLIVQMRNSAGQTESAAAGQEAMLAALRDSQLGIVSAMREVIETSREAQEAQGARLAELAAAAVQTTQQTSQLVEASLVQNERINHLRQGKRERHASVSAFGAVSPEPPHAAEDEHVRDALEAELPLESLTFDTFYPGKVNSFTVEISRSVAEKPGGAHNPFFLYGNVGLGKTHLISATGNHIQKSKPGFRVGYVSASHFSRRLKEALAADAQDAFRENYCHWDVLILDDIQFMGGRVEAQEEFFHIFNVLHQQGRQIVIAGDKAPDRLGLLEQRLISRFSSGIVAELKPPEWETRMQILRHHAAAANAKLPDEICSLIAMRVPGDIRKMVGALRKVVAFAALSREPVTVETASEVLSHLGGEEAA